MNAPTLPNFILAGAPRSGTTSLYHYLRQHPQIYLCPLKEPTYFAAADILSHPDLKPKMGRQLPAILADIDRGLWPDEQVLISKWEDYLRLFQHVRDHVAVGEASVSYIWLPSAAPAIHRALPRAKLIFLLRDPAERLYTLYLLDQRTARRATFRDWLLPAMQAKPDRRQGMQPHPIPLDCGLYATHLQRYFEVFPREQIRIHLHEAYRADPRAVLRDIFLFLGVNPDHPIEVSRRYNETVVPRFPVLHRLRHRMFGDTPLTRWLPTRARRVIRGFYNRGKGEMVMDPADRAMVIDYYRDEILRTQDLIGRDLSAWLR